VLLLMVVGGQLMTTAGNSRSLRVGMVLRIGVFACWVAHVVVLRFCSVFVGFGGFGPVDFGRSGGKAITVRISNEATLQTWGWAGLLRG